MDNLFHQLFHALPLREDLVALATPLGAALRAISATAALEALPRYTVLWPGAGTASSWTGWELITRALSASLPDGMLPRTTATQTDEILRPLELRCYPKLVFLP